MEKLKKLSEDTKKALKKFDEVLKEKKTDIIRDASIQRFEFSFEVFWKYVKTYLLEKEGIDCYSPKSCFRELLSTGLADESVVETLLNMTDHRNLTSHIYDEETSNEVYTCLKDYLKAMKYITERIVKK